MLTNCPCVPQAEKAAEDGRAGNGPCDMGRAVAEGKPPVPPTSAGGSLMEIDLTTPDGSWVSPC